MTFWSPALNKQKVSSKTCTRCWVLPQIEILQSMGCSKWDFWSSPLHFRRGDFINLEDPMEMNGEIHPTRLLRIWTARRIGFSTFRGNQPGAFKLYIFGNAWEEGLQRLMNFRQKDVICDHIVDHTTTTSWIFSFLFAEPTSGHHHSSCRGLVPTRNRRG